VGVVLGVGIFRSPSVVASNVESGALFLALWLVGGLIAFLGALCYGELATAYPDAGGEYTILSRAYGPGLGFLVGWSRMAVIQTGSIAILAYVVGDYVTALLSLPGGSSPVLAAATVVALTALNVTGLRQGRWSQHVLTAGAVLALLGVVAAGILLGFGGQAAGAAEPAAAGGGDGGSVGLALVFVLLAYGGWNEGAYVSAEIRGETRGIGRVLLWGTGAVTLLYVLANAAYLHGLGLEGVAGTDAVAAGLLEAAVGPWGRRAVSVAIVLAALSSANATVITGARSNYALGRDWDVFSFMGGWEAERRTPVMALVVQGGIALVLVGFGALQRSGFESMVAYTAPVYWLVLLLSGAAVVVLRRRDPGTRRPYRVPLYPVVPLLFCAAAAYMMYSAVRNAGDGALLGVAVLAAGLPFLWLAGNGPARGGPTGEGGGGDRT
jgi:amino acid transporter